MIAVIFEVVPAEGRKDEYLDIAARLKSELEQIDGFISVERFQSLTDPNKLLSLSFWKDEVSIEQWRNLEVHRSAQQRGRSGVFSDYRLRVSSVIRDYGLNRREDAPLDSRSIHG
ncbi:MAG: antibiotic biosynthesis monooxygenase [Cyclobacteriaceae bacterium]|nr:antibiotic biosynthesis monooxygenase [Cyclobacteriaceae bacterium]